MENTVKIDEKWRIAIPAKFREGLKPGEKLIVERRGSELVLRKTPREELLEEFRRVKLVVEEKFRTLNAERGKHAYGDVMK